MSNLKINGQDLTTQQLTQIKDDLSLPADAAASIAAKYTKPGSGIPESDLASAVQSKLNASSLTGATLVTTLQGLDAGQRAAVQSVVRNVLALPAPSGIDDTAAINALLAAAAPGTEVHWYPRGTYIVSGVDGIKHTQTLVHRFHGAQLKRVASEYATLPTSGSRMLTIANESNTATFAAVAVTAGQVTFDVPAGEIMPAVGDLVRFRATDLRVTAGSYTYGWETWITGIAGRTLTLAEAFPESFNVVLLVYNSGIDGVEIDDIYIDQSDMPTITPYPDHTGVYVHGRNTVMRRPKAVSNGLGTCAFRLRGHTARVEDPDVSWYYNATSLFGGGRVGYGFEMQAHAASVTGGTSLGCKHSVTFGSDRNSVYRGASARGMTVVELAATTNAFDATLGYTGAIDAHCNLLGPLIVDDCNIDACLYAANFRNGRGRLTNSRVRQVGNDAKFSSIFWYEMPSSDIQVSANNFWFASNGKIVGNPWDLTLAQKGIKVYDNVVDGGSIVNSSISAAGLEIEADRNTITNAALCGIQINSGSAAGVTVRAKLRGNKITGAAGATASGIRLTGNGTNQRSSAFVDLELQGNEVDYSAVSATVYGVEIINAVMAGGSISGNKVQRNPAGSTSNIRGMSIRNTNSTGLKIDGNSVQDAWLLIESNGGGASTHTDLSISGANKLRQLQFTESASASPLVLIGVSIDGNKWRRTDNGEGINYSPQSGSTGMASSTRVAVTNNELATGTSGNSVVLGANAVGHKFEFLGNTLARPISDLSGTYFGRWMNTLLGGTQAWKGGTTAQSDGRLTISAAPTTGAWSVGEQVWNSAPAAAAAQGWTCSVAGTPGTWAAMPALA